jgi:hypothetical protein
MTPVRDCDYTGIFARQAWVFQSLPNHSSILDRGTTQERKNNAGRKGIDRLIRFKMLILKQLFSLGDQEIEVQANVRCFFAEFVGLGVMENFPDATTIAFFRERLRKDQVIEDLFPGP